MREILKHAKIQEMRAFFPQAVSPKLFAIPDRSERCPVQMLLLYSHKRPMSMLKPDAPFYLTPLLDSQNQTRHLV